MTIFDPDQPRLETNRTPTRPKKSENSRIGILGSIPFYLQTTQQLFGCSLAVRFSSAN